MDVIVHMLFFNRYKRKLKRYEFPSIVKETYTKHKKDAISMQFFSALSNLSKPRLPKITVKPKVSLDPPQVFSHQGADTLLRYKETQYAFENRSTSAATKHCLVR